jgi:arylsulfatase A-like enzyme
MASMFTGLYPNQHGVDIGIWLFQQLHTSRPQLRLKQIPDSLETLPEVMRARGYATFGIADNPNLSQAEGFSRGFDHFASADYRGGAELNALLADWAPSIRAADPAFVYLHYMDAHWPYHGHTEHWRAPGDPSDRAQEIARYDAELRYLDARLREAFDRLALADDAIVIVVSDHGEELYERGTAMEHRQHGFQLYDELARVLLMIRDPGRAPEGGRNGTPASLVDVLPTLRELVEAPADPQAAGRSLVAAYLPGAGVGPARSLFAMRREVAGSDRRMHAVIRDGWKYIRTESGAAAVTGGSGEVREELYDLRGDAAERRDQAASQPARRAAMHQYWLQFENSAPRWESEAARFDVSPAQAERLRALGYADEATAAP